MRWTPVRPTRGLWPLALSLALPALPALASSCLAPGHVEAPSPSASAEGGVEARASAGLPRAILLASESYLDLVANTRATVSALAVDAGAMHAFLGVQVQGTPRASGLAVLTRAPDEHAFSLAARYLPLAAGATEPSALTQVSDLVVREGRLYALWHDDSAAWLSTYELSHDGAPTEASLCTIALGALGMGSSGRLLLPRGPGGFAYLTTAYTSELGVLELDERGVPVPSRPEAPNPRRAELPQSDLGSIAWTADGQRLLVGAAKDTLLEVPLHPGSDPDPAQRAMPAEPTSYPAHRGAHPCVENRAVGALTPCPDAPYAFVATDHALFRTYDGGPALRGRIALERLALPLASGDAGATGAPLGEEGEEVSTYALAFDRAARRGAPQGILWAAEASRVRALDGRSLVRGATLVARAPDTGLPLGLPAIEVGRGQIVSHLAVAAAAGTVVAVTEPLDEDTQHGEVATGYALRVTALALSNPAGKRFPSLPTRVELLDTPPGEAEQALGAVSVAGLGQPSEWLLLDRALSGEGARKNHRITVSLGEEPPDFTTDNEELADELQGAPSWSVRVEFGRRLPNGTFELVRASEDGPIHGRSTTVFVPGYDVSTFDPARLESLTERSRRWRAWSETARAPGRPARVGTVCTAFLGHGGEELVRNVAAALGNVGCNQITTDYTQHLPKRWVSEQFARAGMPHAAAKYIGGRIDTTTDFLSGAHEDDLAWWKNELAPTVPGSLYQRQGAPASALRTMLLDDEPNWPLRASAPFIKSFPRQAASRGDFRAWIAANAGQSWPTPSLAMPAPAVSTRSSEASRRRYYWTVRYFQAAAAKRVLEFNEALAAALHATPECRGSAACGYTAGINWANGVNYRGGEWVIDSGPEGMVGGYNWFETMRIQASRAGGQGGSSARDAFAPWIDTKYPDAMGWLAAFRADLLRSAVTLPHLLHGASSTPRARFGAHITALWGPPMRDGLAYKVLAHVARGARTLEYWAFGPEWQLPADGWSEAPRSYVEVARANLRLSWADALFAEGERPRGRVAIQAEGVSSLWSADTAAHLVEPALLHAALTHAGYPVELVDDTSLARGVLPKNIDVLFLTQLHTEEAAQEAVARWVEEGGGTVVVLPGAGTRSEFDLPTRRLDKTLGLTARSSAPAVLEPLIPGRTGYERAGALTPEPGVDPAWQVPSGDVLRTRCPKTPCPAALDVGRFTTAGAEVLARLGAQPALTRTRWPSGGMALQYAFFPGMQHWLHAEARNAAALPMSHLPEYRAWAALAPANVERARPRGALRPATTSVPGVEVAVVRAPKGTALVLFNWTGAPLPRGVTVTLHDPGPFTLAVRDEQSPVTLKAVSGGVELTVPLDTVEVVRLCRERGVRDCR